MRNYSNVIKEINKCKSDLQTQNNLLDFFIKEIPTLEQKYNEIKDGLELVENIDSAKRNFNKSKTQYEQSYEISEGTIGTLINHSVNLQTLYTGLHNIEKSIKDANDNINSVATKIFDEEAIISNCASKIKKLQDHLKANFEICDTCGKPL